MSAKETIFGVALFTKALNYYLYIIKRAPRNFGHVKSAHHQREYRVFVTYNPMKVEGENAKAASKSSILFPWTIIE